MKFIFIFYCLCFPLFGCGSLFGDSPSTSVVVPFATEGTVSVYKDFGRSQLVEEASIKSQKDGMSIAILHSRLGNDLRLVVARNLHFVDPATRVEMTMDGEEDLEAWVTDSGDKPQITVNWITSLASCVAAGITGGFSDKTNTEIADAVSEGNSVIGTHFGIGDIVGTVPDDALNLIGNVTSSGRYGLWLAAFSQEAVDHSYLTKIQPGTVLTPSSLLKGLCNDVKADGVFDGYGQSGPIRDGDVYLDDQSLRVSMAAALYRFLKSNNNRTTLGPEVVYGLADAVTLDTSPLMFPQGKPVLFFELDPPTIDVRQPGLEWRGATLDVDAVADDGPGQVASVSGRIRFPLTGVEFDFPNVSGTANRLTGSLDLTRYGKGSGILTITAVDRLGNVGTKEVTLLVE